MDNFTVNQIDILRCIGVRVEEHENGSQVIYNDRGDLTQKKLAAVLDGLKALLIDLGEKDQ